MNNLSEIAMATENARFQQLLQIAAFRQALYAAFEQPDELDDDPTDASDEAIEAFQQLILTTDRAGMMLVREYERVAGAPHPMALHLWIDGNSQWSYPDEAKYQ